MATIAHPPPHLRRRGGGAVVAIEHPGTERTPCRIERRNRRALAGEADARDLAAVDAGLGDQLASAASAESRQSRGSCSAQPGRGIEVT